MYQFNDKKVVITGGSGGIGATAGKMFAESGAHVLLVDIDENALEETKKTIGEEQVYTYTADVSDEKQVAAYAEKAKELWGNVDIFLNNAGIEGKVMPLDEYPLDLFHKVIDINVKGAYFGLRYIMPLMKEKGGSVIITSSVAGMEGTPNVLPYVTSKHAVIGMMRTAAKEGAPHKIRVNAVNPSPVDNRMMRSLEEGFAPGQATEAKKKFEQSIPLQRYATNEEVANTILFLASDKSSFTTGTINPIDGGMTA